MNEEERTPTLIHRHCPIERPARATRSAMDGCLKHGGIRPGEAVLSYSDGSLAAWGAILDVARHTAGDEELVVASDPFTCDQLVGQMEELDQWH